MTTLLVASTGGHLTELYHLAPRLSAHDGDFVWATNDSPQSRSLLAGQEVHYVPYREPRDVAGTLANVRRAAAIFRLGKFATVVSTGSGIALSFLPLARARRIASHYVESCTRVSGPSLTGRLLRWAPGVRCYTQHPQWAGGAWSYGGSVLEGFASHPLPSPRPIRRAVVTLGTWTRGFRSMLERLVAVLPPEAETLWQTGSTDVSDLPIRAVSWVDPSELAEALRRADVVVTHAGAGSVLDALAAGRCPVIVPRRRAAGEVVDDHQVEFGEHLTSRRLAVTCAPSEISRAVLARAASYEIRTEAAPPPFLLRTGGRAV